LTVLLRRDALQLGERVGEQYAKDKKVELKDMQSILKQVKNSKIWFYNQLQVQHMNVSLAR
jgi:hypothetical protein